MNIFYWSFAYGQMAYVKISRPGL